MRGFDIGSFTLYNLFECCLGLYKGGYFQMHFMSQGVLTGMAYNPLHYKKY